MGFYRREGGNGVLTPRDFKKSLLGDIFRVSGGLVGGFALLGKAYIICSLENINLTWCHQQPTKKQSVSNHASQANESKKIIFLCGSSIYRQSPIFSLVN